MQTEVHISSRTLSDEDEAIQAVAAGYQPADSADISIARRLITATDYCNRMDATSVAAWKRALPVKFNERIHGLYPKATEEAQAAIDQAVDLDCFDHFEVWMNSEQTQMMAVGVIYRSDQRYVFPIARWGEHMPAWQDVVNDYRERMAGTGGVIIVSCGVILALLIIATLIGALLG